MTNATKRWFLWTPAAAVVAMLALLTLESSGGRCFLNVCGGGTVESATRQRESASIAARMRWAELRAMDDIAVAMRLLPPPSPTTGQASVVFSSDIAEPIRQSVHRALEAERAARAPWHSRGRVAVVVASDTARLIGPGNAREWRLGRSEWVAVRTLPPSPLTDGRCVTIIRLRARGMRDGIVFDPQRPTMDACAMVDAFGAPGRAISAALDSSGWRAAGIFTPSLPDSIRRLRHLAVLSGATLGRFEDLSCLGRDTIACARIITDQLSTGDPGRLQVPFIIGGSTPYARSASMLLDALVTEIGPAAFEKVWRSDEPFAVAYAASNGRPLHQLAYEAVRRGYGYADGRTTGFGANATKTPVRFFGSSVLGLAFIAGLALLTGRLAPRARTAGA
jgi:hypothetical protein